MALIDLCLAGGRVGVSIEGSQAPENFLDLDLPGPSAHDFSWKVTLSRGAIASATGGAGWSGTPKIRSFRGEGLEVVFEGRECMARHDPAQGGSALAAAHFAVLGALRREGRAAIHASAIVPPGSADALILLGESGLGKSTLTARALSLGWGFLSDDTVSIFVDATGALIASPLRRTLRIAESAISMLPTWAQSGGFTLDSPRKLIVDPEKCGLGSRLLRARPQRLIFLERGAVKNIARLPSAEAYERLLLHSPQITFDPDGRPAIEALGRLAASVAAWRASLPLESLSDPATLEDFFA